MPQPVSDDEYLRVLTVIRTQASSCAFIGLADNSDLLHGNCVLQVDEADL